MIYARSGSISTESELFWFERKCKDFQKVAREKELKLNIEARVLQKDLLELCAKIENPPMNVVEKEMSMSVWLFDQNKKLLYKHKRKLLRLGIDICAVINKVQN